MRHLKLTRRTFGRTALGAAAAAALTAGLPAFAAGGDYPRKLRIGSTAPGHLKFVVFRNLGLLEKAFADEGVEVEYLTFDGGSAASVALGSGQLDLMYTGNNPALRLAASGADVKAIGLSAWVPQNDTLVIVPTDSAPQTLGDLKGRRVAYLVGTVRHSVFSKALASVGLSTADVESFNFGIENSGPAMSRGDIDAIVESSGVAQKLVDAGAARVLFDASGNPEWSVPYIITGNGGFLRQYPQVATRLLEEDIRLAKWVDAHPEETIGIFVKETGNAEKSVRATYKDDVFYQDPEITDAAVEALKGEEAFMAANGLIKGKVDYDAWIDRSFYAAAVAGLAAAPGTY